MGKLSDKKISARRPGKRERARVKNNRAIWSEWSEGVVGDGTFVRKKLGRKKFSHHLGNLLNLKTKKAVT